MMCPSRPSLHLPERQGGAAHLTGRMCPRTGPLEGRCRATKEDGVERQREKVVPPARALGARSLSRREQERFGGGEVRASEETMRR